MIRFLVKISIKTYSVSASKSIQRKGLRLSAELALIAKLGRRMTYELLETEEMWARARREQKPKNLGFALHIQHMENTVHV